MSKPREWFRVENSTSDPSVVDIHIIDFIAGWDEDWIARNWGYDMGVSARAFVEQLAKLDPSVKTLNVHLNTPGGDMQAGINIANALRDQQTSKGRVVETFIDGLAASIGSVIAMAGRKIHIADNGLMLVHKPWANLVGNADELQRGIDVLNTMQGQIINTYKWHSKLDDAALNALVNGETWMNADEAIANGLATDKVEGLKAAASLDKRGLAKLTIPEKYRAQVNAFLKPEQPAPGAPEAAAASDVLRLCREGNCLDIAEALITEKATPDQVNARIASTKSTRAAAAARDTQIRALCTTSNAAPFADGLVKSGMTVDEVKAFLTTAAAWKSDATVIDASLDLDQGTTAPARIDTAGIYAQLNKVTA